MCGVADRWPVSAGGGFEPSDRVERAGERVRPWPVGRHPQCWSSTAVDETAGDREESGPKCSSNDESFLDMDAAGDRGPADHVVSQDRALQPGAVGVEVARRDVFQAGAFFEV